MFLLTLVLKDIQFGLLSSPFSTDARQKSRVVFVSFLSTFFKLFITSVNAPQLVVTVCEGISCSVLSLISTVHGCRISSNCLLQLNPGDLRYVSPGDQMECTVLGYYSVGCLIFININFTNDASHCKSDLSTRCCGGAVSFSTSEQYYTSRA